MYKMQFIATVGIKIQYSGFLNIVDVLFVTNSVSVIEDEVWSYGKLNFLYEKLLKVFTELKILL